MSILRPVNPMSEALGRLTLATGLTGSVVAGPPAAGGIGQSVGHVAGDDRPRTRRWTCMVGGWPVVWQRERVAGRGWSGGGSTRTVGCPARRRAAGARVPAWQDSGGEDPTVEASWKVNGLRRLGAGPRRRGGFLGERGPGVRCGRRYRVKRIPSWPLLTSAFVTSAGQGLFVAGDSKVNSVLRGGSTGPARSRSDGSAGLVRYGRLPSCRPARRWTLSAEDRRG